MPLKLRASQLQNWLTQSVQLQARTGGIHYQELTITGTHLLLGQLAGGYSDDLLKESVSYLVNGFLALNYGVSLYLVTLCRLITGKSLA